MFSKLIKFLLWIGFFCASIAAAEPKNLFQESQFYIDTLSEMNPKTILALPQEQWKSHTQVSSLLISKDVWIKTTISNPTDKPISKIVYSTLTVSDAVDFYMIEQNGALREHSIAGDTRPYDSLTLKSRYPACEIRLDRYESLTLLTHINSIGRISLELRALSYEEFFNMENSESNIFGIFGGIAFTVFLYYISLFIKARRAYMLYYGLYVLVISAYAGGLFHLGHAVVPAFLSLWYGMGFRMFLSLSYIFLGLFVYSFLPYMSRWMKWFFIGFIAILSINTFLVFYAFIWKPMLLTILDQVIFPIYLLYIAFLMSYTLYLNFHKNYLAYYITVGLGVIFFTLIVLGSAVIGLIKIPLMVQNLLFISSIVIDMVCFVMAHQAQEEIMKQKLFDTQYIMCEQSKKSTIGEMLGNVTHQWKQPLGQISSLIMSYDANKFLGKETGKVKTDEIIRDIKNIVTHLGETIGQFNTFFALDKESVSFDLQDAINASLELIADTCKLQNVMINQEKNLTSHMLIGSRNGIVNILMVFLQNALENFKEKALHQDNAIYIRVQKTSSSLIIDISDNGGGISGNIETIFEPYTSTKKQGSGTGLFIASWMMKERFKGTITAKNTERGAHFSLTFPCINGVYGYSS